MKLCDAHTDFLTEINNQNEREKYIKKIKNKIKTISCAVFTTNSTLSLTDVENFKKEIEKYNKKYKIKLLISIEDLGFVTIEEIDRIIKIKPFSVTLTWNDINQYAGGALTNKGLTKEGVKAIKKLEEYDIIIDTAHLSRKAFSQFERITSKPIFNSHSNINSLFKHKRNLTYKQIKQVVDSGGFLGLTFYEKFMAKENITCRDVAIQFDYLIKKFGHEHFGLGTDLFGIENKFLPQDFKGYFDIKNLIYELKKLNYSNKIIKALICKNFEKFIKNYKKSLKIN